MHFRLAFIALLAALVLAIGPATASAGRYDYLLAPQTSCGGAKQADPNASVADQEWIMRCLHNFARSKVSRKGLAGRSVLHRSADAKTGDMMRCRVFSHFACGRDTLFHVKRLGYTRGGCWGAGENIVWGTGSSGSARSLMRAWLHSTGHRTNILNRKFREVGFGLRKGTFLGRANARVWTTHLGYRC